MLYAATVFKNVLSTSFSLAGAISVFRAQDVHIAKLKDRHIIKHMLLVKILLINLISIVYIGHAIKNHAIIIIIIHCPFR